MLCIVFYLNLWLKYVVTFFKNLQIPTGTCGYPWVLKKCGYSHSRYLYEYEDEYEVNIYSAGRV